MVMQDHAISSYWWSTLVPCHWKEVSGILANTVRDLLFLCYTVLDDRLIAD